VVKIIKKCVGKISKFVLPHKDYYACKGWSTKLYLPKYAENENTNKNRNLIVAPYNFILFPFFADSMAFSVI